MTDCLTEVCVENSIYFKLFYFEAPGVKQTSSEAPAAPGDALRLRRPGGSIEIRGAGGERATGTCFCFCGARAALSGRRRKTTGKQAAHRSKKPKRTFYIYIALACSHKKKAPRTKKPEAVQQ
jgi:hypothetical protein